MAKDAGLLDLWMRHLRLQLLCVLNDLPGGRGNVMLLQEAAGVRGTLGSVDQTRTAMAWLAEQGLVREAAPDVWDLTEAGEDVALRRSVNPGVQPPPRR